MSCCQALSHPAGLRWRQTIPAAARGTWHLECMCGIIVGDSSSYCGLSKNAHASLYIKKTQILCRCVLNISTLPSYNQNYTERQTLPCLLYTHKNTSKHKQSLRPDGHTGNVFFPISLWKTGRSAHWNQCQTPEQSSLAKDSWEHIRHASSWMSFQIQAGKLKSHSGPHGSHALGGYITVSRNSDGFLSKRKKEDLPCFA